MMLETLATYVKDVSVLRKLLFAASHLPPDLPNLWGIAVEFATAGKVKHNEIDAKTAKSLLDNIEAFDRDALKKSNEGAHRVGTNVCHKTTWDSFKNVCVRCKRELVTCKEGLHHCV